MSVKTCMSVAADEKHIFILFKNCLNCIAVIVKTAVFPDNILTVNTLNGYVANNKHRKVSVRCLSK